MIMTTRTRSAERRRCRVKVKSLVVGLRKIESWAMVVGERPRVDSSIITKGRELDCC